MRMFHIIDMQEARRLASTGRYMVIDLRSAEEYQMYHLENALSMPDADIEAIERINRKDQKWILYCNRGSLSFRLASKMAQRGYEVAAVKRT